MEAPSARSPQRAGQWQLRLLGALQATSGDLLVTHWPSRPTALLLATLALDPGREHPREALIERLWPGAPPDAGRNRLRQALSSLRRLFEPPGLPAVFAADRRSVRLLPQALQCDAVEFERSLAEHRFADARAAYGGELLPGIYDDWVIEARARLAARFEALDSLAFSAGVGPVSRTPAAAARQVLLPAAALPLLGRSDELHTLQQALLPGALVTVTGPGGAGKTRLALEAARRAATGFDLVVFVPLAGCDGAAAAMSQLRAALMLPADPASATRPLEASLRLLRSRRALLVLDNLEQLAEAGALLQALRDGSAAPALLVTSRRAIGIAGERELALAPLPLPPVNATPADVAANPGVALFVQGARAVRSDFQVTPRNAAALAAVCRALEGLPLAIELAAARLRSHSLAELQRALAQPLELLARQRGGGRHDSMRAAIDWSWRLLGAPAQALLADLSVFRAGFTVADAAAVTGNAEARELVDGLLADSLLRALPATADDVSEPDGALRLTMLDVIRDYAAAQLAPQHAVELRRRHRLHALALLHALAPDRAPADDTLPNLLQALHSAVDDGEAATALALALALQPHWQRRGMPPEVLLGLGAAARGAPAGVEPRLRSAAATLLALAQLEAGAPALAREFAALALDSAGAEAAARAAALCAQVRVVAEGERRADGLGALLDEAQALAGSSDALQAEVAELRAALAMRFEQRPQAAEAWLAQAEAAYRRAGRHRAALLLRYEHALCLRQQGRHRAALEQAERCEVECAHAGDGVHRVRAINLQGVILADLRRWGDAVDAYRRCVREAWAHHAHYWLLFALWNHGRNLARLRRPLAAARLMAFAEQYWAEHFGALDAADQAYARRVRRLVRAQVGRAATQAAWVEGATWTLAQAVDAALEIPAQPPQTGG